MPILPSMITHGDCYKQASVRFVVKAWNNVTQTGQEVDIAVPMAIATLSGLNRTIRSVGGSNWVVSQYTRTQDAF